MNIVTRIGAGLLMGCGSQDNSGMGGGGELLHREK